MALSIVSNQAASIATRSLGQSNEAATSTAEKLSSGKRINSAADDAAGSAIAARLSAEVAGLQQAGVNAGQASSLLQIADGAFQNVEDILTRAKSLSVQAGSDQISDSERAFLDQEFSALKTEIDRIAGDTEFNGAKLVDGEVKAAAATDTKTMTVGDIMLAGDIKGANGAVLTNLNNSSGVTGFGFMGVQFGDSMVVDMTISNATLDTLVRTGMLDFKVDLPDGSDGAAMLSVTLTAAVMTTDGGTAARNFQFMTTIDPGPTDGAMATALNGAFKATIDTGASKLAASFSVTDMLTLNLGGTGDAAGSITAMLGAAFGGTKATATGTGTSNASSMTNGGQIVFAGDDKTDFTFKVGTGTEATEDEIDVSIGGISTTALGIGGASIATKADADDASDAVSTAIDTLQAKRSDVGAAQNRLDFAAQNVELTRENQEAARSELEDLNVAKAITEFSQQQLLVQAGTSTLSQANQLPQNLLQLFR